MHEHIMPHLLQAEVFGSQRAQQPWLQRLGGQGRQGRQLKGTRPACSVPHTLHIDRTTCHARLGCGGGRTGMTRGQAVCPACFAGGSSTGRGTPTASFWTALVWRVKGGRPSWAAAAAMRCQSPTALLFGGLDPSLAIRQLCCALRAGQTVESDDGRAPHARCIAACWRGGLRFALREQLRKLGGAARAALARATGVPSCPAAAAAAHARGLPLPACRARGSRCRTTRSPASASTGRSGRTRLSPGSTSLRARSAGARVSPLFWPGPGQHGLQPERQQAAAGQQQRGTDRG